MGVQKEGFQRLVGYGTAAGGAAVVALSTGNGRPRGPPEAPTPLTNCPPTEARQVGARQGARGLLGCLCMLPGLRLCRLVTVPLVKCVFAFVCPQLRAFPGWLSGGRDVAGAARGLIYVGLRLSGAVIDVSGPPTEPTNGPTDQQTDSETHAGEPDGQTANKKE